MGRIAVCILDQVRISDSSGAPTSCRLFLISVIDAIRQSPVAASASGNILQPVAVKSSSAEILPPLVVKFEDRLTINFSKHAHLGWTHYRILLSVEAGLKRGFYFEQAGSQRWSKRELQRQIDRALFERVALSRDTRALVRLEKQRGPVETVRYEDAFKDPYLLDFLGLKGAYSEKDLEAVIIARSAAILCRSRQFPRASGSRGISTFCFPNFSFCIHSLPRFGVISRVWRVKSSVFIGCWTK